MSAEPKKVTELYAWVVVDPRDGSEGVPAVQMPNNMVMPLMGADLPRASSIRQMAQAAANETGQPIRLLRSVGLEVVETIEPEAAK